MQIHQSIIIHQHLLKSTERMLTKQNQIKFKKYQRQVLSQDNMIEFLNSLLYILFLIILNTKAWKITYQTFSQQIQYFDQISRNVVAAITKTNKANPTNIKDKNISTLSMLYCILPQKWYQIHHQDHYKLDSKKTYQLMNGEANINEQMYIQIEVACRQNIFEEKKIYLKIYMVSVNGTILAGTVTINPTAKIDKQKHVALDKCPDKNSQIFFMQRYQTIKTLRQLSMQKPKRASLNNSLLSSTIQGFSNIKPELKKYQSWQLKKKMLDNSLTQQKKQLIETNILSHETQRRGNAYSSIRQRRINQNMKIPKPLHSNLEDFGRTTEIQKMDWSRDSFKNVKGSQCSLRKQQQVVHKSLLNSSMFDSSKDISKEKQQKFDLQQLISGIRKQNYNLEEQIWKNKHKIQTLQKNEEQLNKKLIEIKQQNTLKQKKINQLEKEKIKILQKLAEKQNDISTLHLTLKEQMQILLNLKNNIEYQENNYLSQIKQEKDKLLVVKEDLSSQIKQKQYYKELLAEKVDQEQKKQTQILLGQQKILQLSSQLSHFISETKELKMLLQKASIQLSIQLKQQRDSNIIMKDKLKESEIINQRLMQDDKSDIILFVNQAKEKCFLEIYKLKQEIYLKNQHIKKLEENKKQKDR